MSDAQKDPNARRVFNSPLYRRKIKKMVSSAKLLRGIPHGQKIPKGPATTLKGNANDAEKTAWAKVNNYRLTIGTLHFFAETVSNVREPRAKESSTPVDQALAEVAAAQKK
jgi:hypothetical protein